jgi:hypothetical protein
VERGTPFADSASASLVVCKKLASIVRKVALWCGLDRRAWRLQYTRNDNQRLLSWHVPGRDHRTLLPELLGAIGNNSPIPEAATLMFGVRDLDTAERQRLQRFAIQW